MDTVQAIASFFMTWVLPWLMLLCGFYYGVVFGSHYGHRVGYARGRKAERFWSNWRASEQPTGKVPEKPTNIRY